jgi:hypothetical protein
MSGKEAGVQRVVHISITNPAEMSQLPYFKGKAMLEPVVRAKCRDGWKDVCF